MEIPKIGPNTVNNVSNTLVTRLAMPETHPEPEHIVEGMPIRQRIAKEYGIEVIDSDVRFIGSELEAIEETLKEIRKKKKSHLIGVRRIVKNREQRVRLINAALVHAGGAYHAESKTIFLFDNLPLEEIPEVLTHEIGHAVEHFNLEFKKFMEFVRESGYNMQEFRRFFIPGNKFYQIGAKVVNIPPDRWLDVLSRFSMDSLAKNQDVFGEMILRPSKRPKYPWEKNPLERFAWAYEWFVNKTEEFENLAQEAAKRGDKTWLADLKFLKDEVFEE